MSSEQRLTWNGSLEAQRQADAAFSRLKPKGTKSAARKPKRLRRKYKTTKRYRKHLSSKLWKELRSEAMERAGNKYEICGSTRELNVHHTTYERLGRELPYDLEVLCRDCHANAHERNGVCDPLTRQFLEIMS